MKKTIFIILAIIFCMGGCSTANLVYRNADLYLQHKINSYASFNPDQRASIEREVSNYMHWHRKNALPEYIIFLESLNKAIPSDVPLTEDKVADFRAELRHLYKMTITPTIRPTAKILTGLDSQQISELSVAFANKIQEQRDESLNGNLEEFLDKRSKKILDFIEWLAGNLSREQSNKVKQLNSQLPLVGELFIAFREKNQKTLLKLMNNHADETQVSAHLTAWMINPESKRSSIQQQRIKNFEKESDYMITQIHTLLTAQQKIHLRNKFASYIEDMQRLVAE